MNYPLSERVRRRLYHALEPTVATIAGLDLQQLQQAAIGALPLTDVQVTALARHFDIKENAA